LLSKKLYNVARISSPYRLARLAPIAVKVATASMVSGTVAMASVMEFSGNLFQ